VSTSPRVETSPRLPRGTKLVTEGPIPHPMARHPIRLYQPRHQRPHTPDARHLLEWHRREHSPQNSRSHVDAARENSHRVPDSTSNVAALASLDVLPRPLTRASQRTWCRQLHGLPPPPRCPAPPPSSRWLGCGRHPPRVRASAALGRRPQHRHILRPHLGPSGHVQHRSHGRLEPG